MILLFSYRTLAPLLASLLLTCTPTLGATPTPPKTVETHWQGITVTVHQIARLPGNRVSVKFIYRASANAPSETHIAGRAIPLVTPIPAPSNLAPTPPEVISEYYPYSIEKKGELIDEATGKTYAAAEGKDGDAVHPGQMEILEVIRPNEGFFLGAIFECPPLNEDTPPKAQKVSFVLPDLKQPVKGVLLPREENVPLDFFKKPRLLPPGGIKLPPASSSKSSPKPSPKP